MAHKDSSSISISQDDSDGKNQEGSQLLKSGSKTQPTQFGKSKRNSQSQSQFKRVLNNLPSLNDVFSYSTEKELKIIDRRLGYIYSFFYALILGYFFIYIIFLKQLYLETEKSIGYSQVNLHGQLHSILDSNKIFIWDKQDLEFGSNIPNQIFIPTRIKITKDQELKSCPSLDLACSKNEDCQESLLPNIIEKPRCLDVGSISVQVEEFVTKTQGKKQFQVKKKQNKLVKLKGCEAKQWCPAENAITLDQKTTEIHDLIGVTHMRMTIASFMKFDQIDSSKEFSTIPQNQSYIEYPKLNSNTFAIDSLLKFGGINFNEIKQIGAVVNLQLQWNCDLNKDDNCVPKISVKMLDQEQNRGFSIKKAIYFDQNQKEYRDEYNYAGILLQVQSIGIATKFSFNQIFYQIFTLIALVYGIKYLTNFIMLNFYKEKKHYSDMKFIEAQEITN